MMRRWAKLISIAAMLWAPACGSAGKPAESACLGGHTCSDIQEMRAAQSLDGVWQSAKTRNAEMTPPNSEWQDFAVPGVVWGDAAGGSEYLWLRRSIKVPADWKGRRVFVRLGGARFFPHVFVDGKLVGKKLDGWTPLEVEITDVVHPGSEHELSVRCQDWGATFADGFTLPKPIVGDPRDAPKDRVIAPIGGHFGAFGPWDSTEIVARPNTHVTDVSIVPSHRKNSLRIEGAIEGRGDVRVEAIVLEGKRQVLHLGPVATRGGEHFVLQTPFADAKRWSPESPHLYTLRILVWGSDPRTPLDVFDERFGFKEIWTRGPDIYLNGVKRHLLASSTWPSPAPLSRDQVQERLLQVKRGNNIAFRFHTQPWQKIWLEAADEIGLLIVEEGALWCDSGGAYAYKRPEFWQNVEEHLSGMVKRDRNHASLVMWSLENEILHCGAARFDPDAERKLADLGRFVKQLDPHHLITYEADHDPGGAADVIGLHYPHEAPEHHDYPNTTNWLKKSVRTGTEGGLLGSRGETFRWKRDKPLYIGEYLWCPQNDYALGTVFYGPEAYQDRDRFHRLAQARAWYDQTLAYRRAGVSALCPWTAFDGGVTPADVLYPTQKDVYAPVAAFFQNYDVRFFGGDELSRTIDVFNDSPSDQTLTLEWRITGTKVAGKRSVVLAAGGYQAVTLDLVLPAVTERKQEKFVVTLSASGQTLHRNEQSLRIVPKHKLLAPKGAKLLLFDPHGGFAKLARSEGLDFESIGRLDALAQRSPREHLLVVGPDAFGDRTRTGSAAIPVVGKPKADSDELVRFVESGGRALLLEQRSYGGAPLGLDVVAHSSTLTFALDKSHPLLEGIAPEDLRHWRGDHYVAKSELRRPVRGGGRALIVSGGVLELDTSALVEMPLGLGRLVAVQALLSEKLATEPAARSLFSNALEYLASAPEPRKALLLSESAEFKTAITELGVAYDKATPAALATADSGVVLLVSGGAANGAGVRQWLKRAKPGAALYWYAPTPEAFDALKKEWNATAITLTTGHGPLQAAPRIEGPFAAVCAEDFMFKGPVRGEAWMRGFEPDPGVAARIFEPTAQVGALQKIPILEVQGTYVDKNADGTVMFATNGVARAKLTTDSGGFLALKLTLSGTSHKGVLPAAAVGVNGKAAGQILLTQKEPRAYTLVAELPRGDAEIDVQFVNDASGDGEDRNMVLHSIEVSKTAWNSGAVKLLTMPAAVIEIDPPDSHARILVDNIRWAGEKRNTVRAGRYGNAILSALGAPFAAPAAALSWLSAASFTLVGDSPYSELTDQEITLRAAGTVQAEFECADAGSYAMVIRGHSDPAAGVFAAAELSLDGNEIGTVRLTSRQPLEFHGPLVKLSKGRHKLSVRFSNDLFVNGEDRNLYLSAVGFRAR